MSRADEIFQQNCRDILENGVWDADQNVRPHWEDGTPAHTVKKFGIITAGIRHGLRQAVALRGRVDEVQLVPKPLNGARCV